jgi:hypothetical protein
MPIFKRYPWALHLSLSKDLKPHHIFVGRHLGSVDCWLCQLFHQIFGDNLAEFPHFMCDEA